MWVGVAAALLANLLFSTGFVVEKRALSGLPPLTAGRPWQVVGHLLRSPLWLVGAAALGLGFFAQLAVYRTLPLVAAQGLFVTGLVMLLLLSPVFLGEKSSGRERLAMIAILLALVMIVLSLRGGGDTISHAAPTPLLVGICVPALVTGLAVFATAERRSRRRHRMPTAGVPYGVAVGFLYGVSSLAIKGVAGLLEGNDLGGWLLDVLRSPFPYLLMCTGSAGLVLSQTALQRCRASLIVPVCTTVTFLFTVAAGTIAFDEPLPEEPLRLALRLGGALLAVTVLLALPRHDDLPDTAQPQAARPDVPRPGTAHNPQTTHPRATRPDAGPPYAAGLDQPEADWPRPVRPDEPGPWPAYVTSDPHPEGTSHVS
ncbi:MULTISPECIES: DMT family transporter [unclassified Streptomyces]|uniref:DMT family transporter n=1 Tax=unclassified Streptomyces TaxID=2593676 RepID=UPI0022B647C7|nr:MULTISPECIES: DMT family transporter [unclassified Streptomyces]MCZ7414091.1 DMT family transporter [Streptomyces sp. WMMC897]MCZ7431086.1 DMT family transporter [Streptomyces sp. WMMC1477]